MSGYAGSDPDAQTDSYINVSGIGKIKPSAINFKTIVKNKNNVKECFDYRFDNIDLNHGGIMNIFTSIAPPDLNSSPYLISCLSFRMTI